MFKFNFMTGAIAAAVVLAAGLGYGDDSAGYFTDTRGQKYRTVKIGKLMWMAENLNYQTGNSRCYKEMDANCAKYGRLYDWNTAMEACPAGWRLPNDEDWSNLFLAAGGERVKHEYLYFWRAVGKKLKSASGWKRGGNGTDDYGFSALPGGGRYSNGSFRDVGKYGNWWSATEDGSGGAHVRGMASRGGGVYEGSSDVGKNIGFSVRCVRDTVQAAVQPGRPRADIQRVVMQNMSVLRYAYNRLLRDKPGSAGKVTVKFAIDEHGKVIFAQAAESTMNDPEFEDIVVEIVKKWDFGPINKPGDVTEIVYPFVFTE